MLGSAVSNAQFTEIGTKAGLDFVHQNGMVGENWLVEIMGAGVGLFDFDGDGRSDIWLVQGGPLGVGAADAGRPCDRLYRNLGALRFEDVTERSGICANGYGMGIATGDIDNDGDFDVFLTNFGPNQLLENLGDGRFRDVTSTDDFAGSRWSVSATFVDVDADGWLDLYVGNYVDFDLSNHKVCPGAGGQPSYCSPEVYHGAHDRLFRNLGSGRFVEMTQKSGIRGDGAALGVVADDFDNDGHVDIYVANDMTNNLLWLNDRKGGFKDDALMRGVAINGDGSVEASMGVAARDFDSDCDVDLFMTHLVNQTNTLYENDGKGWFTDKSNATGIAPASLPYTGFGGGWIDVDNDGDLDLFSANGAVTAIAGQSPGTLGLPLRQPNQLWLHGATGRYESAFVTAMQHREVSRGTAFGDLDNDGDLDVVVTNTRGPARLYRNDARDAHWLGLRVLGDHDVPAQGSLVWIDGKPCPKRRVATDGSYASAHSPEVLFGLGHEQGPRRVIVRWPDGMERKFGPLETNRYHTLRRSQKRPDQDSTRSESPATPAEAGAVPQ